MCAVVLLGCASLAGCRTSAPPPTSPSRTPRSAAHIYVVRPVKAIPEPDPFVQGVVTAFTEELVLNGYDVTGTTQNPDGVEAVLSDLRVRRESIPGLVGIYLTFVEAPIMVGFGTSYTRIACVVYDAVGRVILKVDLSPPQRRTLGELFLPPARPDVAGRRWGRNAWRQSLSLVLPRRGPWLP